MRAPTLLPFLAILKVVFADVHFTAPEGGSTISAGSAFTITWTDGGNLPSLSDASSYKLVLYSGSNAKPLPITTLVSTGDPSSRMTTVTIEAGLGGSTPNAYFLGITTFGKPGGRTINYSKRFTLSGMIGDFTEDVKSALVGLSGTEGPADVLLDGGAAAQRLDIRQAAVPYNEQIGPTKYAPMQPVPGTAITAQNTSPLFPTSSVVIATTFLPIATIETTLTAAQTFVVASNANTAAAQPQPSDDMAKFLKRWKD